MPGRSSPTRAGAAGRLIGLGSYGFALAGPVGGAGAQFLLSLVLLRLLDTASFGRFALLLVVAQFSWGLWSALFCAPLPRLLNDGDAAGKNMAIASIMLVNLVGVAAALPVFAAIAHLLGETGWTALAFGAFISFSLLRWFARALAYAHGFQRKVVLSDAIYAAILIGGTAWLALAPGASTLRAYGVLALSMLVALVPFGLSYIPTSLAGRTALHFAAYGPIWRDYTRWSLFGVATSELTANAHAYMVAFFFGPGAFAPIAATALMIRPVAVATNALIEFERARMARTSGPDRRSELLAAMRFFRAIIVLIVVGTAATAGLLLWYDPQIVYPASYGQTLLALGTTLWFATVAARVLPFPESALLQSLGAFRPLAMTGLWSALVSCVSVAIILVLAPPIWSIAGVLLGHALGAILIWIEARRKLSTLSVPQPFGGQQGVPATAQ